MTVQYLSAALRFRLTWFRFVWQLLLLESRFIWFGVVGEEGRGEVKDREVNCVYLLYSCLKVILPVALALLKRHIPGKKTIMAILREKWFNFFPEILPMIFFARRFGLRSQIRTRFALKWHLVLSRAVNGNAM